METALPVTALPIAEAALKVGLSRPALMKAIKDGRLAYTREDGRIYIDQAELHRVYKALPVSNSGAPPEKDTAVTGRDTSTEVLTRAQVAEARVAEMEKRISELRDQIDDIKNERDQERSDRKAAQAQIVALLQDNSRKHNKGFFDRLFGG